MWFKLFIYDTLRVYATNLANKNKLEKPESPDSYRDSRVFLLNYRSQKFSLFFRSYVCQRVCV